MRRTRQIKKIIIILFLIIIFWLEWYMEYQDNQVWAYCDKIYVSKKDMLKQKIKFENEMRKYDFIIKKR